MYWIDSVHSLTHSLLDVTYDYCRFQRLLAWRGAAVRTLQLFSGIKHIESFPVKVKTVKGPDIYIPALTAAVYNENWPTDQSINQSINQNRFI